MPQHKSLSPTERLILQKIQRSGDVSQSDLAPATGISQQSISRITGNLAERGLLSSLAPKPSGKRGQPSPRFTLNPSYRFSIGVAIMADALALTLMNFAGERLADRIWAMPTMRQDTVVASIRDAIEDVCHLHVSDRSLLCGIGIGISGFFIEGGEKMNTPHMLDDWALMDMRGLLEDAFGLPVWIENDGNAAAVGELLAGVGRQFDNFVYLYVATDIGGGAVVNGQLMRGSHGNVGELGQMLPPGMYAHPNLELLRQILAQQDTLFASVSDMLNSFDPSWPAIADWIARAREGFGLIASASAALMDPDVIVLGGRIPRALSEQLIPEISMYRHVRRGSPRPLPAIVPSGVDGTGEAVGAAFLPLQQAFF